jgi:hypothetical protein
MSKNLEFYADFIPGRKFLNSVPEKLDTDKTVFSEDLGFFGKIVFRDYLFSSQFFEISFKSEISTKLSIL